MILWMQAKKVLWTFGWVSVFEIFNDAVSGLLISFILPFRTCSVQSRLQLYLVFPLAGEEVCIWIKDMKQN